MQKQGALQMVIDGTHFCLSANLNPCLCPGTRNKTYMAAVRANLGTLDQLFCITIQQFSLFFSGVGYSVTASLSVVAAKRAGRRALKLNDEFNHHIKARKPVSVLSPDIL